MAAAAAAVAACRSSLATVLLLLLMAIPPTSPGHSPHQSSATISAPPSLLPDDLDFTSSASPPSLSPDVMPVLPSPGGDAAGLPPVGLLPTIPSSQSPPNPDALEPDSAVAPAGSAGMDSGAAGRCESSGGAAFASGLLLMWLLELLGQRFM